MPGQRWRVDVREELRAMRGSLDSMRGSIDEMRGSIDEVRGSVDALREEIVGLRGDLKREFQQNRDVLRSLKAATDGNTEMVTRCVETLERVSAESQASRAVLEDLSDDIRAQREGLLAIIDELRRRNGPPGAG